MKVIITWWKRNFEVVVALLAFVAVALTAVKVTLFLLTVG